MSGLELAEMAARILGSPLALTEIVYGYPDSRSNVIRCQKADGTTVIVKRSNSGGNLMAYEASALTFLHQMPTLIDVFPRLLAYNAEASLMIVEDLAPDESYLLGNILMQGDYTKAEAALLELQRTIAHVHGMTAGLQPEYQRIRAQFPDHAPSPHRANRIEEGLHELAATLASLSISPSPGFQAEFEEILSTMTDPGPFLTFTHGDLTPANVFYINGNIRMFDLEAHGFRHCLLDGSFGVLRYLHSLWARQIPLDLRQQLTNVYHDTLSTHIPETSDVTTFNKHLGASAAGWLAGLCHFIERVWSDDHTWGRSTLRERILAGLVHFALLDQDIAAFNAFAETMATLHQHLRREWPGVEMPFYPAFSAE